MNGNIAKSEPKHFNNNDFIRFVDVLKFDLGKGSLLSALPYLVMSITLQFNGFFVDWLRKNNILTTTQVRKHFYTRLLVF